MKHLQRRFRLRISPHTWRVLGRTLLLLALVSGAFGLLLGTVSAGSTDSLRSPESVPFWVTRGCFAGPAFVLLFVGYMSLLAARRGGQPVRCSEVLAVLGVALSLSPILVGMSLALQPTLDTGVRVLGALLCLWPGLFLLGLVGIFWALVSRH